MIEPAKEPDLQTMTAVGKVLVSDDSTALLLGLLGYSATKLWNTAVWHSKEVWKTTGKIPSYAKMDVAMKQEHPLWYRRLHSQSAQAVLEELWQSYRSWFALRKKGDAKANPPGFRRKTDLVGSDLQAKRRKVEPENVYGSLQHPERHLWQAIPLCEDTPA